MLNNIATAWRSPLGGAPSLAEALAAASDTRDLRLGAGVLHEVKDVFLRQFPGAKALVVCDPTTWARAGESAYRSLHFSDLVSTPPHVLSDAHLHAEHGFVERIEAALRTSSAVPVAVGSGTINDLVKLASHRVGRPYMCVATAASMDGYTAFGASITHRGAKKTFTCPAPRAVVADVDVLRCAPSAMTASGYADLQAKIPAGADWILASSLQVESIDDPAWAIVQGGLRDALADPAGARRGDAAAVLALTTGLMRGGFAMQRIQSSRPASGAEHQFSHLWDMEHHTHLGSAPSHGFKVGVATLAVTSLYEELLRIPIENLDVERCVAAWPEWAVVEADVRRRFGRDDFCVVALEETAAKHVSRDELRGQLTLLKGRWPLLREEIRAQLLPFAEVRRRLEAVGAPTRPVDIGVSVARLRASFQRAYFIRRRFTVLDLAVRTGALDPCLDALFGPGGVWSR